MQHSSDHGMRGSQRGSVRCSLFAVLAALAAIGAPLDAQAQTTSSAPPTLESIRLVRERLQAQQRQLQGRSPMSARSPHLERQRETDRLVNEMKPDFGLGRSRAVGSELALAQDNLGGAQGRAAASAIGYLQARPAAQVPGSWRLNLATCDAHKYST